MISNGSITIYNIINNRGAQEYQRTIIKKVFWQEKQASNRIKSGFKEADHILALVPVRNEYEREYISPKEFDNLKDKSKHFTFKNGDIIVHGALKEELDPMKTNEFNKKYQTYVITSIDKNMFGSKPMHHFKIGAK